MRSFRLVTILCLTWAYLVLPNMEGDLKNYEILVAVLQVVVAPPTTVTVCPPVRI